MTTSDEPPSFQDVPWRWWDGLVGVAFLLPWRFLFLIPRESLAQLPLPVLWAIVYLIPVAWRLLFPLWLARRRLPTFRITFPGPRSWLQESMIAAILVIGIVAAQVAILQLLAIADGSLPSKQALRDYQITDLLLLLSSITIAPATEEVFFRGLIFNWLKRFCPTAVALLIQGIVFALLHPVDLVNSVWLSLFGVILGLVYQWRQTLLTPILFHVFKNSVAVTAASVLGVG